MSEGQGTLSAEQTAVAAFGISLAVLVYSAAVFMCGRTCCIDHHNPGRMYVQRHFNNVNAVPLRTPFAHSDLDSDSSTDVVPSPNN